MPDTIAECSAGQPLSATLALAQCHLRSTPQGQPFILGELRDHTATIGFVWWGADQAKHQDLQRTGFVTVSGSVESYRDRLQLVIEQARSTTPDSETARQLLSAGASDQSADQAELAAIIGRVADPLRSLLTAILIDDSEFAAAFAEAPAAIAMHHPWIGGLLAHTVAVGHLAEDLANRYPELDRDLMVAGALLHDHAKVDEFTWDRGLQYTTAGNLVGHITIGCQRITDAARAIPDFPPRLLEKLIHVVLAHHGELAYGSPKEPVLAEAIAVHLLDTLDSRLEAFGRSVRESRSAGEWTEVARPFGRRLYKGP